MSTQQYKGTQPCTQDIPLKKHRSMPPRTGGNGNPSQHNYNPKGK